MTSPSLPPTHPFTSDRSGTAAGLRTHQEVGHSGRRRRPRRLVALLAVGGLLAASVGVSSIATPTTGSATDSLTDQRQRTQTWTYGSGDQGSTNDDPRAQSSGPTATVDSQAATAAEGKGVALIDTVLSNGEAAGTGIVLTSDGEVLTNYHVVEDSTSIRVTIASTGTTYTATVVGADPTADVALLQLKGASGLTAAAIDDDTLRLGDDVTAVGNAGGTGTLSAADGDLTALSTSITTTAEDGVAGETLKGVIETDADVVPGDSGGPLVDEEGEVVGIDTAASSGSEINGYAIAIDDALSIVATIRSGTETSAVRIGPAAFLGIELGDTSAVGGAAWDTGSGSGATVAGVVDGDAAADAGLVAGDTITKLGSTNITDTDDLTSALARLDPGDHVTISWTTSDGQRDSAAVTLGASPLN